jgi:hypothetical protein
MVGGAGGWVLAALAVSLLLVSAGASLALSAGAIVESALVAAGASFVLSAGAFAESAVVAAGASLAFPAGAMVESVAVAGWAAGATSSELAGFVAMVSVWDNAPCCHARHPSSVAISIFVFILLSPIRLRFVFMLNMDCKISGGVRLFWAAASFVAADVERKFHARGQSML